MEEVRITIETVDDFKRMFEGASMKVDVKNKDAKVLTRTPVVACSNSTPWRWVGEEHKALLNRMYCFKLKEFEELKNMPTDINPLAWLAFFEELAVKGAEECASESDAEPTESDFDSEPQSEDDRPVRSVETETVSIVTEQEMPLESDAQDPDPHPFEQLVEREKEYLTDQERRFAIDAEVDALLDDLMFN
jgi:hypothetical protein